MFLRQRNVVNTAIHLWFHADNMQIGQIFWRDGIQQCRESLLWVIIMQIIESVTGANTHAYSSCTYLINHGVQNIQSKF